MPSPQKQKGKSYENDVAKFLTEQYGNKFMRVQSSGAFLGGSNHHRRHDMTEGQVRSFKGDITPPDNWRRFNCEVKFYKDFKFHQLYNGSQVIDTWIKETLATANPGDLNLIFMKFNRIGEYVAYQSIEHFRVGSYTQYGDSWRVTSKEQFWTPYNKERIHFRCTQ